MMMNKNPFLSPDVQQTLDRLLTNGKVMDAVELLWLLSERGGVDVTEDVVFHLFLFWWLSPNDEPADPVSEGKKSPYGPFLSRVWNTFDTYYMTPEDATPDIVKIVDYYVTDQYIDDGKKQLSMLVRYQETTAIAYFVKQLILRFEKTHINRLQDILYYFLLCWWNEEFEYTNPVQQATPVERLFVANILYLVDDDISEISHVHPIVKGFLNDEGYNARDYI